MPGYVTTAAEARNEREALFFAESAEMLERRHARTPFTAVLTDSRALVAVTADRRAVALLPLDWVRWTAGVESTLRGIVGRAGTDLHATTIVIALAGKASAATMKESAARGLDNHRRRGAPGSAPRAGALSCPVRNPATHEVPMTRRRTPNRPPALPLALLIFLPAAMAARQAGGGTGAPRSSGGWSRRPSSSTASACSGCKASAGTRRRERADAIAARIAEVATDPALGADSLRIEETDVGHPDRGGRPVWS